MVCEETRKTKRSVEFNFAENIKENLRSFYTYIRSQINAKNGIGPLKWQDEKMQNAVEWQGC